MLVMGCLMLESSRVACTGGHQLAAFLAPAQTALHSLPCRANSSHRAGSHVSLT